MHAFWDQVNAFSKRIGDSCFKYSSKHYLRKIMQKYYILLCLISYYIQFVHHDKYSCYYQAHKMAHLGLILYAEQAIFIHTSRAQNKLFSPWWHHGMEQLSARIILRWISSYPTDYPNKAAVVRNFVIFVVFLDKLLKKHIMRRDAYVTR